MLPSHNPVSFSSSIRTLKSLHSFLELINSGKRLITPVVLDLRGVEIADADVEVLAKALTSEHCPANLTLYLSKNYNITDTGVKALAAALTSEHCPANLTLKLSYTLITDAGVKALAEALKSKNCLNHLRLDLGACNDITDTGFIALAEALKPGHCPPHLTLGLFKTKITDAGVKALAEALTSKNYLDHLTLDLRACYKITDTGVIALAAALTSEHCPPHLTLNLRNNEISVAAFERLLKAIESKKHRGYLNIMVDCSLDLSEKIKLALQAHNKHIIDGIKASFTTLALVLKKKAILPKDIITQIGNTLRQDYNLPEDGSSPPKPTSGPHFFWNYPLPAKTQQKLIEGTEATSTSADEETEEKSHDDVAPTQHRCILV